MGVGVSGGGVIKGENVKIWGRGKRRWGMGRVWFLEYFIDIIIL